MKRGLIFCFILTAIFLCGCEDVEIYSDSLDSELPKVYVNTPNNEMVMAKEMWLGNSSVVIKDNSEKELLNATTSIKGRGNSTWSFPKKPYALKLDKKESVLGMPKHKRWVLLANYVDRTLMRNDVAFKMAQMCMEYVPRGKFVELYLNDEYQGNYYLCEQIKIDKNRVNIKEFDDDSSDGNDGGFLLEFDTNYQTEINYFKTKICNYPVTIKEPDEDIITTHNHKYFQYIKSYINEVEEYLKEGNFEEAFKLIDYKSYIDFWIICEVTGNMEPNSPKSCYMYKDANSKLKAGPVWDFDYGTYNPGRKGFVMSNSLWYKYLLNSEEFKTAAKQRWGELKPKFETIYSYIDETTSVLQKSQDVNFMRWPIGEAGADNKDSNLSFDAAVKQMKESIQERIFELDMAFDNL